MTELIWIWSALLALLLGALSLPWSEGMAALAASHQLTHRPPQLEQLTAPPPVLERVAVAHGCAAEGTVHPAAALTLHRWRPARVAAPCPSSAPRAPVQARHVRVHGIVPRF